MTVDERNYLIHPHFILLILLLAGVTALFVGFSASYLYTRVQSNSAPLELPSLFYFNTLLLITSSFTLIRANKAYLNDETEVFRKFLVLTLILSILFLLSQIAAWYQLFSQDIFINHSNMSAFMYVISGVHFAHVIAGIPFLVVFIYDAYKKMKEPVSVLVYFSDPTKRRKLKLLTIYWHYLDFLWIYLVLFFLINFLIK